MSLEKYEFSLLKNISPMDVINDPFPHVVIHDALPIDFASKLIDTFPFSSFPSEKSNHRYDISASSVHDFDLISDQWKNFIQFHSSKYFFSEVINIFKNYLERNDELTQLIQNHSMQVGRRNVESFKDSSVLMDAQISINTPVQKKSSVRKIHVDSPNKLYSGLFYLRMPDDDSFGGDLQLFSWKPEYSKKEKLNFYKEGVSKEHVNVIKEISYNSNTLVLFLNSLDALHGVTERDVTRHTRTFVNLVAELPFDLYTKDSLIKRKLFKIRVFLSKIKKFVAGFLY